MGLRRRPSRLGNVVRRSSGASIPLRAAAAAAHRTSWDEATARRGERQRRAKTTQVSRAEPVRRVVRRVRRAGVSWAGKSPEPDSRVGGARGPGGGAGQTGRRRREPPGRGRPVGGAGQATRAAGSRVGGAGRRVAEPVRRVGGAGSPVGAAASRPGRPGPLAEPSGDPPGTQASRRSGAGKSPAQSGESAEPAGRSAEPRAARVRSGVAEPVRRAARARQARRRSRSGDPPGPVRPVGGAGQAHCQLRSGELMRAEARGQRRVSPAPAAGGGKVVLRATPPGRC